MVAYVVSGEVRDVNSAPLSGVTVRAHKRSTGALIASAVSSDGTSSAGDSYYSNVELLLHGNGNGTTFTDTSPSPKTVTPSGSAVISTAQSKFGASSMYFDGASGASVSGLPSDLLSGAFTIESWIYPTALAANQAFFDTNNGAIGGFGIYLNSGRLKVTKPFIADILDTGTITTDSWQHIAVTRDGSSVIRAFINGSQVGGSVTDGTSFSAANVRIATTVHGSFQGYADDLRVTKGVARYTGAFTPPLTEYADALLIAATPVGSYSISLGTSDPGELQIVFLDPDDALLQNDVIHRTFAVGV